MIIPSFTNSEGCILINPKLSQRVAPFIYLSLNHQRLEPLPLKFEVLEDSMQSSFKKENDWFLITAVVLLASFGLIMIYSSSYVIGLDRHGDSLYFFKKQFEQVYGLEKDFSSKTYQALQHYSWPGNVREIKNVVERLLVTTSAKIIDIAEIPNDIAPQPQPDYSEVTVNGIIPLKKAQLLLERQLIGSAIKQLGSTYKAAKALHVDQSTIVRKISRIKQEGYEI